MRKSAFGARLGHGIGLSAVALAGCAGIIGIEDRTVDSDASSFEAGPGASGSAGATGSSGGAAGGAGTTGSTGSGATGGTGAATSGGTGTTGSTGTTGVSGGTGVSGSAGATGSTDSGSVPPPPDAGSCADPCPLKTGLNNPWAMTSDANRVYWVEFGTDLGTADGAVSSCPVAGCGSGMVSYTSSQINPRGVAVDGQNIYWGSASYSNINGGIWTCPIAGCPGGRPTRLANPVIPYGIAVDASYVYWVDSDDNSIHRVLKTPETDGGLGPDIVLYNGLSDAVTEPERCVVDSTSLFLTDVNGSVYRMPVTGGTPTTIGTGPEGSVLFGIAIDPANVYYGEPGAIFSEAKTASNGGGTITEDVNWPQGLAVDPAGGVLYWANAGSRTPGVNDGTVGRLNTNGTGEVVLATKLLDPFGITVSGSDVFWISVGTIPPTPTNYTGIVANTGALYRNAK